MAQLIGIDIGGTKTHVVVEADGANLDRPVRTELVVSSSDWRAGLGDAAADARGLTRLLVENFGSGVLASALAVGAHGCENTEQCHDLERALGAMIDGPVVVVNDSELIPPAMGAERAIGVVVGTGSIATARDARGALVSAGGWGWFLGDEGSAPGLVREATRAVLDSRDRGEPLDALGRRLFAAFDAGNGDELALAVTETGSAEALGERAPEVFAAADDGSDLAVTVVRDAGAHLAALVDRLLLRGIAADSVVAGGSVIERQPRLQHAFASALADRRPGLALRILDRPPVEGAVALARGLSPAFR
ncbi:N-acetylglucosamine kinase [Leifsonia sp. 21MFCrub1.1]|uniref:N-acetylglucosamine kinase n=1 Tax=Leifsonia sp. 21MFCrub1.1 TaxID=1798223 RepID=UPI0008928192|nr:BadF/BadG/BcrA/BcrD ATPase family protein [Leifsonia sp. 21MFCrub1.1]SEA33582.1 BadF-type ATPase [Leifsonia sp. 21MFCrub1.1]